MSGISLTASMRSNLLSLQNIASQQDIVQNRLATGLKVSSAIDNPSSYYTASSLNNRAADLTALLDAMSQGIQTIKAASEAIDSGTKFLEQAKAVANQALETAQPVIARVSNETELLAAIDSGQRGLIMLENDITLSETITLKQGQSLVGTQYLDKNRASVSLNFDLGAQEGAGIIAQGGNIISDLTIHYNNDVRNGRAIIEVAEGASNLKLQNLQLNFDRTKVWNGDIQNADSFYFINSFSDSKIILSGSLNLKTNYSTDDYCTFGLGEGNYELGGESRLNIKITSKRESYGFRYTDLKVYDNAQVNIWDTAEWGEGARASRLEFNGNSQFNYFRPDNGKESYALLYGEYIFNDASQCNISGQMGFYKESTILQFNSPLTRLNVQTSANVFMGNIVLSAVKGVVISTKSGTYTALHNLKNFAVPQGNSLPTTDFDEDSSKTVSFSAEYNDMFTDFDAFMDISSAQNAVRKNSYSTNNQYREIIGQYDNLITDSSYKGINLLEGQNLKINFNEDRSSKIDINGVNADNESLGIKTTEWQTAEDIEQSISELETAINSLRGFASAFGNYYSIVTTRQDFTENLINVLEEGADKLTLADMNQESANMLALQTSQQLAVNSLSLASQASQSILRLF